MRPAREARGCPEPNIRDGWKAESRRGARDGAAPGNCMANSLQSPCPSRTEVWNEHSLQGTRGGNPAVGARPISCAVLAAHGIRERSRRTLPDVPKSAQSHAVCFCGSGSSRDRIARGELPACPRGACCRQCSASPDRTIPGQHQWPGKKDCKLLESIPSTPADPRSEITEALDRRAERPCRDLASHRQDPGDHHTGKTSRAGDVQAAAAACADRRPAAD